MTKPEDWNEHFSKINCTFQKFEVCERMLVKDCPYHKSGGLKGQWNTQAKDKYDAKKRKMRRKEQRAEEKEERKNRHRENGCVML